MTSLENALKVYKVLDDTILRVESNMRNLYGVTASTLNPSKAQRLVLKIADLREATAQSAKNFYDLGQQQSQMRDKQDKVNQSVKAGQKAASGLSAELKKALQAYRGLAGMKKAINFVKDNLAAADTQNSALWQSQIKLANGGFSQDDYGLLLGQAKDIGSRTAIKDSAVMAGATALAPYLHGDRKAVMGLMNSLTDYGTMMNGGKILDSSKMAEYAEQMGKWLSGDFSGLAESGLQFNELQQQIMRDGDATARALVLDEVIAQSYGGLAEQMGQLPVGVLQQFKHAWQGIKETIGNQLYPAVQQLFQALIENMPQIQSVMGVLSGALYVVIGVLSKIAEIAGTVARVIVDHWSWIGPIVWGLVAAFAAYNATLLVSWLNTVKDAAGKVMNAVSTVALTVAITAMDIASKGLNATLMANPLNVIIMLVIALIAVFYAVIGVINKLTGSSLSATGMIAGAFMELFNVIYNIFGVLLWNIIASVVNFLANCFASPLDAAKILFYDFMITVTGFIANIAEAIETLLNSIPFVEVNITSGLNNLLDNFKTLRQEIKDESGWQELMESHDYRSFGEGWEKGNAWGQGAEDSVRGFFAGGQTPGLDVNWGGGEGDPWPGLLDNLGGFGAEEPWDDLLEGVENTAGNTAAMANSMPALEEEMKYLRDIAEREAINRYTTAEIHVEMVNNNTINKDLDLDGVVNVLEDKLFESMLTCAEGVHL